MESYLIEEVDGCWVVCENGAPIERAASRADAVAVAHLLTTLVRSMGRRAELLMRDGRGRLEPVDGGYAVEEIMGAEPPRAAA